MKRLLALGLAGPFLPSLALAQTPPATTLPQVNIIAASPLLGTGIDRNLVPAQTQIFASPDIAREGPPGALQTLTDQAAGVTLDSASGNPYQPTLMYHGFAASPLQGTPQGVAVYVNGVRFNQPFGDTVNWDLIPDIAIDSMNLEGSNPVYGLNALGGSLNIQLKNGFTTRGAEAVVSGGSFGQVQGQFQYGRQSGNEAAYVGGTVLHQDGWRDLQTSDIYNVFGDLGWRGDKAEVHLGITAADTVLNGPGTSPVELLDADPSAQFTAPNRVSNRYLQISLSGNYDISETTSLQAVAYYNNFLQRVVNGNAPADTPCNDGSGLLCQEGGGYSTTRGGGPIPDFLNGGPYAELDEQTTNTNGYGASVQVSDTGDLFGRKNHLAGGFSFDGAQTEFDGVSFIGGITPLSRVFAGPGIVIDEPGTNSPVRVGISDASWGAYATDTLELTAKLAATLAGRFNAAQIDLHDQGGGDLTGSHVYDRFNPAVGVTYKVSSLLTAYAGYSEANRAPTPAELSCASAAQSCSLANFFVGDPNLKQVVAHTVEAGVRGAAVPFAGGHLTYTLGLYRTELDDDIVFVNSVTLGRAFFTNVGQTRRQGIDSGLQFKTGRLLAYINYSHTDATFQSGFVESAGSNPQADASGNIAVRPGNRLPGIPANLVKLGLQYRVTDAWTVGGTAVAQSGAYLFGDEANLTPKLPAYAVLNLNTSYQLTRNIQLFGLVQNVTDQKYYTYGTFAPTTSVFLAQAPNATNPRSYSPAAPVGGFVGVRVTL
jgi:outer membrane receptor protein involved in Fe transport